MYGKTSHLAMHLSTWTSLATTALVPKQLHRPAAFMAEDPHKMADPAVEAHKTVGGKSAGMDDIYL